MEKKESEPIIIGKEFAAKSVGRPRRPFIENQLESKVRTISEMRSEIGDKLTNYKKILGSLITEGDITLIWGPPGTGKSIFAYQLGEAIARGRNFFDLVFEEGKHSYEREEQRLVNQLEPSKVLYVDFEMSAEKILMRYEKYPFSDNFNILKFENYAMADRTLYLKHIRTKLTDIPYKVLIIDNLSNLLLESDKGDKAAMFMNELKQIAKDFKITLILLNHSNKFNRYDMKTPDQMKGNANLTNFADALFCLSPSTESNFTKYLKQQKCRYGEEVFTDNNVIKMDIINMSNGFLGFAFDDYTEEKKLLDIGKMTIDEAIIELIRSDPEITGTKIAELLKDLYNPNSVKETFIGRVNYHIKKRKLREIAKERNNIEINNKNLL